MTNFIHFLNGKFVTEDKLLISPRDLGFARGYAVADFLVTHNHQPFKLSQHIDRLFKSAEIIGLRIPWDKGQIADWVKETLAKNDKDTEKTIKILVTGGMSKTMHQADVPTLIIVISAYLPKPASYYRLKLKTVRYKRPYPEAKTTNYTEAIKQFSKDADISEVIYYDDNQVFEGSGSNIFAVINNRLVTAKSNILPGVTRNTLLEILKLDIPIEVADFSLDELLNATEVFLTGSAKGVRSVINIDGKVVGDGQIGKITEEVAKQYEEYILKITGKKL